MSDEETPPTQPEGGTVHVLRQTINCPSCGLDIPHDKRFELEVHDTTCRQPEIRMRRLESRVFDLERIVGQLPGFNEAVNKSGVLVK